MRALCPAIAFTMAAVAEATPLRWQRKFNATRSASRSFHDSDRFSRLQLVAILAHRDSADLGVHELEGEQRCVEPGEHASLADDERGFGARMHWNDRVGGQIAGAAEIFEKRRSDDRLDHETG